MKLSQFIYIIISFFIALLLFTSCTLIRLGKETKIIDYSTGLVGYISSNIPSEDAPVIVAAFLKYNGKINIAHHVILHETGPYELFVPEGNYYIAAFIDKNKNLIFDKGEPAGQYKNTQMIKAKSGSIIQDLDILISDSDNKLIDLPIDAKIPAKNPNQFHSTLPGAIADLDDEIFSDEYGKKGYWNPLEFFLEIGGNIYFLEPYDAYKTPVLFVHGASGSPQQWRTFFDHFNREKYQPWFYYYPSGATIESMSYLLYWKLFNLQRKYQFNEMCIVAHSMGGLVVRSFLADWGKQFPSITQFISISTPWAGQNSAEIGVEYSPVVIPVWKDIQPDGGFISSLYKKELPATVKHYLFFGYKGNRNPFSQNNDTAVPIASQLDPRAQAGAELVYGFNEDHVSILYSDQVMDQVNTILEHASTDHQRFISGGTLQIFFTFDVPDDWLKPRPRLLFRSVNKQVSETIIYLRNKDSGRELGPFPSGEYTVSLIADAFVPEPRSIPVTIQSDSISSLSIALLPRGSLIGQIVNARTCLVQPFANKEPDSDIKIRKIILSGNDITRTLIPGQYDNINKIDYYLSGIDCLTDGCFYFYNLPAGEYRLTIEADGFKTFTADYNVIPGQTYKTNTIELLPVSDELNKD
ncbi:MAG: alpha/beta hydrolase [Calditrichaceae bacterium]|nr:alpha/beta hydrolase [Calditrichaceae bacterium]HES60288.1 alpha/beta hydrolase [Caldithrix sp.]